jgi:hypothetical protein
MSQNVEGKRVRLASCRGSGGPREEDIRRVSETRQEGKDAALSGVGQLSRSSWQVSWQTPALASPLLIL